MPLVTNALLLFANAMPFPLNALSEYGLGIGSWLVISGTVIEPVVSSVAVVTVSFYFLQKPEKKPNAVSFIIIFSIKKLYYILGFVEF